MKMAYLSIESYSRGDGDTHRILKFGLSSPLAIGFGASASWLLQTHIHSLYTPSFLFLSILSYIALHIING